MLRYLGKNIIYKEKGGSILITAIDVLYYFAVFEAVE